MNLLEAFFYTFAADASQLDKGLSDSKKKTDDLKDSVAKADIAAEKLGSSFISLVKSAAGLIGIGLTVGGLTSLTLGVAENTSALGQQARQMNVNVSTLDAWRKSITESGGDANAFTSTLGNLAKRFRDPEAALLRYSQTLGKLSSFRAQRLGAMVGLDPGTVELLRKGRAGVEELIKKQKEQGVITKEQVAMTDKFNHDLRVLKMSFSDLKTEIGIALIPIFQDLLDGWNGLSKWVKENKEPLKDVFIAVAGIVTAIYLPAMIDAGIATLAATWPIILLAAGIAALALVVADIIGYFRGFDSVTGRLAKKFPELDAFLQASKVEVLALWDALVLLFTNPLQFLENLKNEIKNLLDSLLWKGAGDTIFSFLGSVIDETIGNFKLLYEYIEKVISFAIKGFEKIGDAWKKIKGWFGAGEDEVKNAEATANKAARPQLQGWETPQQAVIAGQDYMAQAATAPVTTMTANSIANTRQQTSKKTDIKIDNIEVKTQATDAQGVADGLTGKLKDTVSHYDDGLVG